MANDVMTWREALQAMLAGEEVEQLSSAGIWHRTRMSAGGNIKYLHGGTDWVSDPDASYELAARKWRRVPKVPRVHELPAQWKAEGEGLRTTSYCLAEELEASLREDELVSLKGISEESLNAVMRAAHGSHASGIMAFLRSKVVKP